VHQVAVTGMGIVSPLGIGVADFKQAMFDGRSAVTDSRGVHVPKDFPVAAAGRVPDDMLEAHPSFRLMSQTNMPRTWSFAGCATEEAIQRLPAGENVDAIVYAAEDGIEFEMVVNTFREFDEEAFNWDQCRPETSPELIRRLLEYNGNGTVPGKNVIVISNACVSANQAIGIAFHHIRSGKWRRAIAGGVWVHLAKNYLLNFHMLGALSVAGRPAVEISSPFSKDRSGFVLGEGAATLLLEREEDARAREAHIFGRISGTGSTSDAYQLTGGRPDGSSAARAMRGALEDARLVPDQIDAISAHGTSTPMNDRLETLAIRNCFGDHAYKMPVVSLKSQIGHSMVGSGALQGVASLLMLAEQKMAPTINYREPDPECDLDYVPNHARAWKLDRIMSNNLGFGGQNVSVIYERVAGEEEFLGSGGHEH